MIVQKTSVFPASRETVFQMLQQPETLQYIAWPYATFTPVGEPLHTWSVGSISSLRLRLFGIIPFGTHTIRIVRFDPDGVSSREENVHLPAWNHEIRLKELDGSHTAYTDRVEMKAGWKTPFIWLWASAFYRHRQRKWIRLLASCGA